MNAQRSATAQHGRGTYNLQGANVPDDDDEVEVNENDERGLTVLLACLVRLRGGEGGGVRSSTGCQLNP